MKIKLAPVACRNALITDWGAILPSLVRIHHIFPSKEFRHRVHRAPTQSAQSRRHIVWLRGLCVGALCSLWPLLGFFEYDFRSLERLNSSSGSDRTRCRFAPLS